MFSKGLKIYFDRFQWKNTELNDFVGALEEAWQESKDQSMGPEFNLTSWCDSWLKTSGVNIIEPVIELTPDGKVKSLQIRQTCDLRGQNRLRQHKLDIAIYQRGFLLVDQPHVIKDVVISEELTTIDVSQLPDGLVFGAVNINHGEYAYAKVRYDPTSVKWF